MILEILLLLFINVNFVVMTGKTECFNTTSVYNTTWGVNWCVPGCYYDSVSHNCKPCSTCHQMFKPNPDGPILQCQVDLSHTDNLCAMSKMTLHSVLMEKGASLPSLFLLSFFLSCFSCCGFIKWFYKRYYWRKKVQKTDRYNSRDSLRMNEIKLLYRGVDKVEELSTELDINITERDHGGVKYSRVETCYRYLWLLCNSRDCDITMIANALCKLGYAQLIYEIFTEQLVVENCFVTNPSTDLTNEHISDVYDRLNRGGRLMELQFLIAIELGLTLSDIDTCRGTIMGALDCHVLFEIFKLWKEKDPSHYTVENVNIVLRKVGMPEDHLLP